jgi:hypothetical protein
MRGSPRDAADLVKSPQGVRICDSHGDKRGDRAMTRVTSAQWATLETDRKNRFHQRLVKFIEGQFGRPEAGSDLRSPEQVADAALEFAETVGAMTEAQIARIAILLVAVNRQRLPPERVEQLRAVLLHPDKTPDERIEGAAAFLGIAG